MRHREPLCRALIVFAAMVFTALASPAVAQVDFSACDTVTCDSLPGDVCSDLGFKITFKGFTPGYAQNSGKATYEYEICSPAEGACSIGGASCGDHKKCALKCNGPKDGPKTCAGTEQACTDDADCAGTCDRECVVDEFHGLSHFDVTFPQLGAVDGCLPAGTEVTGTCSVGTFGLGDGSCFDGGTSSGFVAKCDSVSLSPGQCLTMKVEIAGETTGLGVGAAIVVDKASNECTASCIAGPSCEPCEEQEDGEACLTRTIGFWGTHPWITNDYVPVTVCGKSLGCAGADDGKSDPACLAGSCDSVMEGLGSIPSELGSNQPYVAMVKQLTAAKLNLNATASLFGTTCSSFEYGGKTIQEWIATCEGLCSASKATITTSGCIEALNAFNNSQDTLPGGVTPSPFERPSVDDHGNVSGADPSQFTKAQGQTNPPGKLVIGKNVGSNQCQ